MELLLAAIKIIMAINQELVFILVKYEAKDYRFNKMLTRNVKVRKLSERTHNY